MTTKTDGDTCNINTIKLGYSLENESEENM